jgi:hypothetical protein
MLLTLVETVFVFVQKHKGQQREREQDPNKWGAVMPHLKNIYIIAFNADISLSN